MSGPSVHKPKGCRRFARPPKQYNLGPRVQMPEPMGIFSILATKISINLIEILESEESDDQTLKINLNAQMKE